MKKYFISIVLFYILAACTTVTGNSFQTVSWGEFEGISEDGVSSFLGIEYARANRWELPQLNSEWGVKQRFDSMGPACPQDGLKTLNEDCLFLNVFMPEGARATSNLPVLVWIHGGGLRAGQGGDGARSFVKSGIVLVTFNYRLGALGFYDWKGWSDDQPRNFGQADMVAALEWVNKNISKFGGDPDSVTIMGHSAGGMGVQLMMVDPRANGLFARAISDAGYGTWPFPKVTPAPISEKETIPEHELNASVDELVRRTPYFHLPYIGTDELPVQPIELFRSGAHAKVPYMTGANSFDGLGTLAGAGYSAEDFFSRYETSPELATLYQDDLEVSIEQASRRLFGDMRYVFASHETAIASAKSGQPTFLFLNDYSVNGHPGTTHGGHYAEAFQNPSSDFSKHLISFVRTGTPDPSLSPQWPQIEEDNVAWMVFSPEPAVRENLLEDKISAISELEFPGPSR